MSGFIITADQRLAAGSFTSLCILAPSGAGKTFLARTLDPVTTLFVDYEAGMKAVQGDCVLPNGQVFPDWKGDSFDVRKSAAKLNAHPWELARALACAMAGPDPAAAPDSPYGATAYTNYCTALGGVDAFAKYSLIFTDSITVAGRHCFEWCQRQPEAFSEKSGKPDPRGAYGLHGREMVKWLTTLQHTQKTMVVVGILDKHKDDFGRVEYAPQIPGQGTALALPGIFDEIATLGLFSLDANGVPVLNFDAGEHRGIVCQKLNPYGVPAKDRSGRLAMIEAPDLGALLKKITHAPRTDQPVFTGPAPTAAAAGAGAAPPPTPSTTAIAA